MDATQTMRRLRQAWGYCAPGSQEETDAQAAIATFAESDEWRAYLAERQREHVPNGEAYANVMWT